MTKVDLHRAEHQLEKFVRAIPRDAEYYRCNMPHVRNALYEAIAASDEVLRVRDQIRAGREWTDVGCYVAAWG